MSAIFHQKEEPIQNVDYMIIDEVATEATMSTDEMKKKLFGNEKAN